VTGDWPPGLAQAQPLRLAGLSLQEGLQGLVQEWQGVYQAMVALVREELTLLQLSQAVLKDRARFARQVSSRAAASHLLLAPPLLQPSGQFLSPWPCSVPASHLLGAPG
jgi:hypothetical protein